MKKIVNTLKQKYKNSIGMGIGDYIRGSFFLIQLCEKYNFEFGIDFSQHPICKFLENKKDDSKEIVDYDNVLYFFEYNRENMIMNFINSNHNNNIHYLYTNNHPNINKITDAQKNIIKNSFNPTKELNDSIECTLNEFNLIKNDYIVIHIRVGDRYIVDNKNIDNQTVSDIINILNGINAKNNYLLLSDCNQLKEYLKIKYPILNCKINKICHLTHNADDEAIKNTLIDFFLISYSKRIISMSIYNHNSGFSEYCAIMNNIPINLVRLNNYFHQ